jgi:hypothetical protein
MAFSSNAQAHLIFKIVSIIFLGLLDQNISMEKKLLILSVITDGATEVSLQQKLMF